MHAHELRFCAQAYRLKIFFNAWANAARLRKVEDEGVDAWFLQYQESIRLRRVLRGASSCHFRTSIFDPQAVT
ncbi:unnamed protein product, partial [Symbiodinium necroappetens]